MDDIDDPGCGSTTSVAPQHSGNFPAEPARIPPCDLFSVRGGRRALRTSFAWTSGVSTDDSSDNSGVIDLFAIHQRSLTPPAPDAAPASLDPFGTPSPLSAAPFSAPPPAFTTDLDGDADDDDLAANPFARKPRNKIAILAGAGGVLVFFGILIASLSGGSSEPVKASAAAQVAPAPPPAPIPAPVVVAEPPAPVASPHVAAPPTTGAALSQRPAPRASRPAASRPRAVTAGGVKLMKVQSAGVP
jgi:hypothetical protein